MDYSFSYLPLLQNNKWETWTIYKTIGIGVLIESTPKIITIFWNLNHMYIYEVSNHFISVYIDQFDDLSWMACVYQLPMTIYKVCPLMQV